MMIKSNVWLNNRLILYLKSSYITVVLLLIFCIGIAVRTVHLFYIDVSLPAHSGGLFLLFAESIRDNQFRLPATIQFYSDGGIPFAYPPIPFYILALMVHIFPNSGYVLMNLLPVFFSILALPVIYKLSKIITDNKHIQLCVLAVFSLLPSAFREQIEDEGLAESMGTLAVLVLMMAIHHANKKKTVWSYVLLGLMAGACVMTSPGSAYAALLLLSTFSFYTLIRNTNRILQMKYLFVTFLTTVVISSIYWFPVIQNHGFQLLTNSFTAQHQNQTTSIHSIVKQLMRFDISKAHEPFIWNAVIALGMLITFSSRYFYLPVWLLLLFIVPREGGWLASIPGAILGGFSIHHIFNDTLKRENNPSQLPAVISRGTVVALSLLLGIYAFYNAVYAAKEVRHLSRHDISQATLTAAEWIQSNTDAQAKVIIIQSHLREWTPKLMQRTVLNVPQGLEWKPEIIQDVRDFNNYIAGCSDLTCIQYATDRYLKQRSFLLYTDSLDEHTFLSNTHSTHTAHYQVLYREKNVLIGEVTVRGLHK